MQILPRNVFDRVIVNRIGAAAKRGHLTVVVFVNEWVNRRPVQCPVKKSVEEIVNNKQQDKV